MLSVSTAFQTSIQSSSRTVDAYIVMNGVTYAGTDLVSLDYSIGVTSDRYFVGDANAGYLKATLQNVPQTLNVDGLAVEAFVGVELATGTFEYVKLGKFYVDESSRESNRLTLECFDKMIQLDVAFIPSSTLTYPISLSAFLSDLLTGHNYTISIPSYLSAITIPQITGRTKRQALGYVAALFGGFAYVDRINEHFKIKVPSKTPSTASVQTIAGDTYFAFQHGDTVNTITGVELSNGNLTYSSGTSAFVVKIETPLVASSSVASGILAAITGTPMVNYRLDYISNPALELGDSVTIVEYLGETEQTFSLNIGMISVSYGQGLRGTLGGIGEGQKLNANPTTTESKTIVADRIKGGTLTVGGINDINGKFELYDTNGELLYLLNQNGMVSERSNYGGVFPDQNLYTSKNQSLTYKDGVNTISLNENYSTKRLLSVPDGPIYYWRAASESKADKAVVKVEHGTISTYPPKPLPGEPLRPTESFYLSLGSYMTEGTLSVAAPLGNESNAAMYVNEAAMKLNVNLTTSQSVGIGTTTPSNKLHVNSGTVDTVALFESTDRYATIKFKDGLSASTGGAEIGADTDSLYIRTGATLARAVTVDSSGNVGIGTTAPGTALDVVGDIRTASRFISTVATGTPPLSVSSSTVVPNLNADQVDGYHAANFLFAPTPIPNGADFNDYVTAGMYYCSTNGSSTTTPPTGARSILNNPFSAAISADMSAFSLLVEKHAGVKQTLSFYNTNDYRTFVRNSYNSNWGPWVQVLNADGNAHKFADGTYTFTSPTAGAAVSSPTIVFPANRFAGATPKITVSVATTAPQSHLASFATLSATSFVIWLYVATGASTASRTVHWRASSID